MSAQEACFGSEYRRRETLRELLSSHRAGVKKLNHLADRRRFRRWLRKAPNPRTVYGYREWDVRRSELVTAYVTANHRYQELRDFVEDPEVSAWLSER